MQVYSHVYVVFSIPPLEEAFHVISYIIRLYKWKLYCSKALRFLYSAPDNNSGFCWTNFTFEMRWLLYYRTKTLVLWDRLFLNELSQENKLLTHPEHEDPQDFYFHILKAQGNSACTWNKQNSKEGIKTLKYKLL